MFYFVIKQINKVVHRNFEVEGLLHFLGFFYLARESLTYGGF
jgi:hypothetical protein